MDERGGSRSVASQDGERPSDRMLGSKVEEEEEEEEEEEGKVEEGEEEEEETIGERLLRDGMALGSVRWEAPSVWFWMLLHGLGRRRLRCRMCR
jgi:hypothetical protein